MPSRDRPPTPQPATGSTLAVRSPVQPLDAVHHRALVPALVVAVATAAIGVAARSHGTWQLLVPVPGMTLVAAWLRAPRARTGAPLAAEVYQAAHAPVPRHHAVLLLVDRVDHETARAVHYARTLAPSRLRALHVAADRDRASSLEQDWRRFDLAAIPLEVVDCPGRRPTRAVLDAVALEVADGDTELTVVLPAPTGNRREQLRARRAHVELTRSLSALPRVTVTVVRDHVTTAWPATPFGGRSS